MFNFFKKDNSNEVSDLKRRIQVLEIENSTLRSQQRKVIPVINVKFGDPIPEEPTKRRDYVSTFCNLYDEFLENKLMHLIALTREELDWSGWNDYSHPDGLPKGMTRVEYDAYLRGTNNAFKMLLEYGLQLRSENLTYKK